MCIQLCGHLMTINMAFGQLATVIRTYVRNLVCSMNVLNSYRNARNHIQYTNYIKQTCDEFVKYRSSNGSFTDMTPRTVHLLYQQATKECKIQMQHVAINFTVTIYVNMSEHTVTVYVNMSEHTVTAIITLLNNLASATWSQT